MKVLKIKDWLQSRQAQFEILDTDFGHITEVRRIKDDMIFSLGISKNYGYYYTITAIHSDCIHVFIEQWEKAASRDAIFKIWNFYGESNVRLQDKMLPINDLKYL